jgi:hypothetical protein
LIIFSRGPNHSGRALQGCAGTGEDDTAFFDMMQQKNGNIKWEERI